MALMHSIQHKAKWAPALGNNTRKSYHNIDEYFFHIKNNNKNEYTH